MNIEQLKLILETVGVASDAAANVAIAWLAVTALKPMLATLSVIVIVWAVFVLCKHGIRANSLAYKLHQKAFPGSGSWISSEQEALMLRAMGLGIEAHNAEAEVKEAAAKFPPGFLDVDTYEGDFGNVHTINRREELWMNVVMERIAKGSSALGAMVSGDEILKAYDREFGEKKDSKPEVGGYAPTDTQKARQQGESGAIGGAAAAGAGGAA